MRRSQGRTKIRAHQSSGASRASRHGPARYFSFRSLQGTRHRARHSLPICRSQRRAQRPWKACSRTYVATRFFSQVEPPPRFIRKLKEPPLNRTNIFFGESHSDWLPVRGGESGDFVFRRGDGHAFAKIAPASRRGELAGERDRLIWLKGRGVACPEVINWQEEQEGACLVITAIPGVPAADLSGADLLKAWPSMGQQLGAVHSLSVDQCPFERRLSRMFGRAVDVVSRNAVNPDFLPDEDKSTPQLDLLARVERELPVRLDQERTDMVVCHGDPCMPNFMVDPKTLQCTGLIDLGRLGTADRYADLALMIANAEENWAAPDEAERAFAVLFNVLGIEAPDRERSVESRETLTDKNECLTRQNKALTEENSRLRSALSTERSKNSILLTRIAELARLEQAEKELRELKAKLKDFEFYKNVHDFLKSSLQDFNKFLVPMNQWLQKKRANERKQNNLER